MSSEFPVPSSEAGTLVVSSRLSTLNTQHSTPFDSLAAEYDTAFTETRIGRLMRDAVWRRLDARFKPGDHVLELNCGTGEDALHLAQRGVRVLATDIAPAMVAMAQAKAEAHGVAGSVTTRTLAIEEVASLASAGPFDGILSDFGGLNCVGDLSAAARATAKIVRPGGVVMLCVMGPIVPWEWAWYLRQGKPGKAFRRLRPGGVAWQGLTIRYPSVRTLRKAFAPRFRLERVSAVGALVPPPYMEKWAARHPQALARLDRWERQLEARWPLPLLADHYLAELVRI